MVNFTTANIYNVHEHTLTCDLKNYMTPLRNINRRVPVEKVLYWLSKYDCSRCRRISVKLYQNKSLRCFVNVLCLLTDSENMLKWKGKNARDIYSSRSCTDGCLRSSLEVLKTDRTFWILLLTLAKTEMNDVQI